MNKFDAIIKYIPNTDSADVQWITWHEMLKKAYGQERANQAFTVAFAYLSSSGAKTNKLRDYGRTVGLDIDTNLLQDASRIVGNVKDSVGGIFDSLGSFFKTGETIVIVIVILILIPVFMLIFNIAKNPNQAIGAASQGFAATHGGV